MIERPILHDSEWAPLSNYKSPNIVDKVQVDALDSAFCLLAEQKCHIRYVSEYCTVPAYFLGGVWRRQELNIIIHILDPRMTEQMKTIPCEVQKRELADWVSHILLVYCKT
jgi:hypothetical protein